MRNIPISILLILLIFSCKNSDNKETSHIPEQENKYIDMNVAYIGTYTKKEGHVEGKAEGIYTIYQDIESGSLRFGKTVATVINPSFVITSGDKKNLYAVSELGPKDGESGFIHSFTINTDYSLTETGKISTGSYAPCYIAEDATGRFVFVANYVGGMVMMYEKENNGSLKEKQKITLEDSVNSHPHSVNISADNKYVYISDLGRSRIYTFTLNEVRGSLQPHSTPYIQLKEGTGPRHFEFSANRKFAFSINEHASTISIFSIADTGELSQLNEVSTLPEDFTGKNSTADIHLHPSGNFIYASNRGHNSIVAYKLKEGKGALELLGFTPTQGKTPRNFAISADGNFIYVANQDSDNISAYRIDPESGILKELELPLFVKTPVCIEFL